MEAATPATATDAPAETAEPASEPVTGSRDLVPNGNKSAESDAETSDERDESGRFLSREAASYRRRLRETESERDQLRERVQSYERDHVERIAADAGLQVPGDVWTFGATLDTLRDDDGGIDSDAVDGLVKEIVKDRPGLQARPIGDIGIGKGAAAAGTPIAPEIGLSQLLKPGQR
jgi:hypothetical protein